jgi:hypothetical protein
MDGTGYAATLLNKTSAQTELIAKLMKQLV